MKAGNLRAMSMVVIYTLGHFVIAAACSHYITGAPLDLAATDALVEPGINAVWL